MSTSPLMHLGLVAATSALALSLSACCMCGGDSDAAMPASVPTYSKASSESVREILGVTLQTYNAQAKADKVQSFYDKKLKKSWKPVDSKWRTRRKLAGTSFEYRRFKKKKGKAYLMIDMADNPKVDYTFTEVHYCPDGPARCKPK